MIVGKKKSRISAVNTARNILAAALSCSPPLRGIVEPSPELSIACVIGAFIASATKPRTETQVPGRRGAAIAARPSRAPVLYPAPSLSGGRREFDLRIILSNREVNRRPAASNIIDGHRDCTSTDMKLILLWSSVLPDYYVRGSGGDREDLARRSKARGFLSSA